MASHMNKHARYYFIADKIIYDINLQTLSNLNMTISTRLLTSAAACFTCLLEEQGKIVSRKVLMHAGWEKHGFIVTTNTLNQNILLLRKAIAQITEEPILKTVFRQGITIPDEFSIISFDTRESLDDHINNNYQTEIEIPSLVNTPFERQTINEEHEHRVAEKEEKPPEPPIFSYTIDNKPAIVTYRHSPFKNKLSRHFLINVIFVPLILIIVFFIAMFKMVGYYKNTNQGDYLPLTYYKKTATVDGLEVYLDGDKCPADYALPFLEQHRQDFQNTRAKNLYVSCEKNIKRTSVFLCNKDVKDPTAECSSFYYL